MAVHVQEIVDLVPLDGQASEDLLAGGDGWMEVAVGLHPLTVDVAATNVTAAVAVENTIDIHHWDDLEDVLVEKKGRLWASTYQVLQASFHNERADGLGGMLPCYHCDHLLPFLFVVVMGSLHR